MVTVRMPRDPNTLSNYHDFKTTHTSLDVAVDFSRKRVTGTTELVLESLTDDEVEEIVLDTSYLDIVNVQVNGNESKQWKLHERSEPYGSALSLLLPKKAQRGSIWTLKINSATTENCTALQWLTPAQTTNQRHPYLFSQCEAIHARSIFPCQDTPDNKSTYQWHIRSPLPVITSGLPSGVTEASDEDASDGCGKLIYHFTQKIPIPSYLVSIASGDIATAAIGPRSYVATGPEELAATQREFDGETEKFLTVADNLIFPYKWTQYNVLVLPPSFPFGASRVTNGGC